MVGIAAMSVSGPLAVAVSGLRADALRANVVANNIVNANTPGFKAGEVRTGSIVTAGSALGGVQAQVFEAGDVEVALEFSRLIQAETAYRAAAATVRVGEEIARVTVDLVA
jgi:flagellar hook protein FlgE